MLRDVIYRVYHDLAEQGKYTWRSSKALAAKNILSAGVLGIATAVIAGYAIWAGARVSIVLAALSVLLALASSLVSVSLTAILRNCLERKPL